jgi:hypothetical protein
MIVHPARSAGLTLLGCHSFRATGITVYLLNGGPPRATAGRSSSCRATYSSIRIFACVARITATACFAAYSADCSGYARRHSATPAR